MSQLHADDLILFARIVEAGSFTTAADATGVPKATLSRRLSQLEDALGERLIQRSTRRLVVTEFGRHMLEHATRLRAENEEAMALAQHQQATPQGTLRVSLPPEFREFPVAEVVTRFAKAYPDVHMELDLSARRVDLVAERFDVAVRAATQLPDDATLVARRIRTQHGGLYAAPGYLRRHGEPATPADLVDHFGLVLSARGEPQVWDLACGGEHWSGLPARTLEANSLGLQRDLAVRGLGIVGLTSHAFAHEDVQQGRLQRVLPDWQLPDVAIWCVTPGRRLLPRRTEAFIEVLKDVMTAP